MQTDRLTRKTFLRMSLGAVATGIVGCGSDSGDGTAGATEPSSTGTPSETSTASSSTTANPSTTGTMTTGGSDSSTSSTTTATTTSGSSDSGSTGGGTADCSRNGAAGTQFDLHDHTLEISADMLQPGTPLEALPILGSGHPHALDLSGEQVDALLAGDIVVATSSFGSGHEHQVTLECV